MGNQLSGIGALAGAADSLNSREYVCPSCKARNKVYAGGRSVASVCAFCRGVVNIASLNAPVLVESGAADNKGVPALPLGSSGAFMGANWRVVGFIRRLADDEFETTEYLLFSEIAGFRWLFEFEGDWITTVQASGAPDVGSAGSNEIAKFKGVSYALDEKGFSVITSLMGEFYWEPGIGDKLKYEDYRKEDEVLSREIDGDEVQWWIGRDVELADITKAFGGALDLPHSGGFASNRSGLKSSFNGSSDDLRSDSKTGSIADFAFWWLLFAAILIVIHGISLFTSRNEVVLNKSYSIPAVRTTAAVKSTQPVTIVTEPFDLKGGNSNLRIDLVSPVDNSWVDFDGIMVEKTTGAGYVFEEALEYYHGVDQGESWSEGSQDKNVVLSSIPNGTYMISLKVVGSAENVPVNSQGTLNFNLRATRGVPMWGNFVLVFLLVSILPAVIIIRGFNEATRKW